MNIRPPFKKGTTVFGWWCTLLHDYPEDEGTVYFTSTPTKGEKFKLPSSDYKEEWVVEDVDADNMSFTAVQEEIKQ